MANLVAYAGTDISAVQLRKIDIFTSKYNILNYASQKVADENGAQYEVFLIKQKREKLLYHLHYNNLSKL